MNSLSRNVESELISWFLGKRTAVIAFSGGVDSALVARAAVLASERHATNEPLAVFALSPTATAREPQDAKRLAAEIGIRFHILETDELSLPEFVQNDVKRCYYCKRRRFTAIREFAQSLYGKGNSDLFTPVEGSNADDLTDYRPGRQAVTELAFRSPLAELGIEKVTIRNIAKHWMLSVADKPSNPCLATRIAYGLEITNERLRQIEQAEAFLATKQFSTLRVRMDTPLALRLEIPENELNTLFAPGLREETVATLKSLGFKHISLDLEGFRSGNMNIHHANISTNINS